MHNGYLYAITRIPLSRKSRAGAKCPQVIRYLLYFEFQNYHLDTNLRMQGGAWSNPSSSSHPTNELPGQPVRK